MDKESIRKQQTVVSANTINYSVSTAILASKALAIFIVNYTSQPPKNCLTFSKEVSAYLEKWKADALTVADFEKSSSWNNYSTKGTFTFYNLKNNDNFTARFVGELPCSMDKFQKFLNSWEARKLDPLFHEGTVLERIDDSCEVQHIVFKPGFPLKTRDSVSFKYHTIFKEEALQVWLPVVHSAMPPQKGKLRSCIEVLWRVKAIDSSHCTVHMMMNGNFSVKLQQWVRKGLWRGTMPLYAARVYQAAVQLQVTGSTEVPHLEPEDVQHYEESFTSAYKTDVTQDSLNESTDSDD